MDWISHNSEWIFSGVGVLAIGFVIDLLRKKSNPATQKAKIQNRNAVVINLGNADHKQNSKPEKTNKTLEEFKNETRILFIDDDVRFKVAKILVRSGWVHTKLIKDVDALDDADITSANILFIDVQGVGVSLGFNDEGLGLALAIKNKYPEKKVIIYSAESKGDRFHAALQQADASLNKNADPYEFQKLVEDFTIGLRK